MSHRPRDPIQTGNDVRDVLFTAVREQLEACASMADEMAARLTRSGKDDQAIIALELASKIRARKPV